MNTTDDRNLDDLEVEADPVRPVAPDTTKNVPDGIGVYDRPERRGLSPVLLIGLLILALVIAYFLWQFVF